MTVIFIIVLIISYKGLSQMFDLGGGVTLVLAICVAALSIIGLSGMTTTFEKSEHGNGFSFKINLILLPYILLPIAIIVTVIIRWIKQIHQYFEKRKLEKKYFRWKP